MDGRTAGRPGTLTGNGFFGSMRMSFESIFSMGQAATDLVRSSTSDALHEWTRREGVVASRLECRFAVRCISS
jgi:hypothetical protein